MHKNWTPAQRWHSNLMIRNHVSTGKALLGIAAMALLAACSSGQDLQKSGKGKFDPKYGVSASARVATDKSEFRKGGGHYKIGRPYKVAGKRYVPKDEPGYNRTGMASWYGDDFHGRLTANGEIFDMNTMTAAHPTLPLPSYARVTNIKNGRSVIVRINDRGPYAHKRIIDLSKRVAEVLAFKNDGITKVRVKYIGKARMDGLDARYLEASYRGPGQSIGNDFNAVPKEGERRTAPTIMMASAAPAQKIRQQPARQPIRQKPNYILAHVPGFSLRPAIPSVAPDPAALAAPPTSGWAPIDLTGEGYNMILASAVQLNYAVPARIASGHAAIDTLLNEQRNSSLAKALEKRVQSADQQTGRPAKTIGQFPTAYANRLAVDFAQLAAVEIKPLANGNSALSIHKLKSGVGWKDIAKRKSQLGL